MALSKEFNGAMSPGYPGKQPFNIELLIPDQKTLVTMKPVSSQDIYDGMTTDLHEDGLYSVSIFGRVGDERRDQRFSFIDVKVPLFHPIVYRKIVQLKGLYGDILTGARYAKWDPALSDFIPATELDGDTGYSFFATKWLDIKFKESASISRQQRVALLEKYKHNCMISSILVMPAGLRDVEIGADGRPTENEINDLYRRLISVSNTIVRVGDGDPGPVMDRPRVSLQNIFNQIYDLLEKMLSGKNGFIQSKWGSRRVFNGTRNVITSMNTVPSYLGSPHSPRYTDTVLGLLQMAKGTLPLTQHHLLVGYLSTVFATSESAVRLVNKDTLESEFVDVSPEHKDHWYTPDGLEKIINSYSEFSNRHVPIEIDNYYLGLVYNDGDYVKIFNGIEDLPEKYDRKYVTPLTLSQLLYLSCYKVYRTLYGFLTRYPIIGMGSTYRSTLYVKTTMVGMALEELGLDWEPRGADFIAPEFPRLPTAADFDAMSPHQSRLQGLDGDFDGDMGSLNIVYSSESTEEGDTYFKKRAAYVDPKGGFRAGANTSTVALVVRNMTGV